MPRLTPDEIAAVEAYARERGVVSHYVYMGEDDSLDSTPWDMGPARSLKSSVKTVRQRTEEPEEPDDAFDWEPTIPSALDEDTS